MAKKKAFTPLFYLASIVFLPWWISFSVNKWLESWVTNWWNTGQSQIVLNNIQGKESSRKIQRIRGTPLLGRNDQGILGNTSRRVWDRNP